MKNKIRTLVVEDFGMMRLIISNILARNSEIEVVGTARNGKEGFEKAMRRKPDVIVTDMVMPEYDGMHLVKEVMSLMPTPIILISALEKDSPKIFEALEAGAFDFVDKPGSRYAGKTADDQLVKAIMQASKVDPATLASKRGTAGVSHVRHVFPEKLNYDIMLIGASTGGPKAVEALVEKFPKNLSIPIIICLHMPHRHVESFARRLDGLIPLPVKMAENKEVIRPGHVYIGSGLEDLLVKVSLKTGEPVIKFSSKISQQAYGPSLNRLFESAASVYGKKAIGVLLTGTGSDGAKGMACIYQAGGLTIAQDEKSSLVPDMPKSAIDAGCVKEILDLNKIAGYVMDCF